MFFYNNNNKNKQIINIAYFRILKISGIVINHSETSVCHQMQLIKEIHTSFCLF